MFGKFAVVLFCLACGGNAFADDTIGGPRDLGRSTSSSSTSFVDTVKAEVRKAVARPTGKNNNLNKDNFDLVDINLAGFCSDTGLLSKLQQFVDDTPPSAFSKESRSVAFAVNIGFAEAPDFPLIAIPLIFIPPKGAKDQQGNEIKPVVNCETKILGGLSAFQPLRISVEFAYSKKIMLTDAAKVALEFLGTTLTTASILGPHTATAGAGILAFSAGLTKVNEKANAFLQLFDKDEKVTSPLSRWETNSEAITIEAGSRLTFTKSFKATNLNFRASELSSWDQAFSNAFKPANSLTNVYAKAGTEWGALHENPTPANFTTFCTKLQQAVEGAYGSDKVATAAAIYYLQVTDPYESVFKSNKATCLERSSSSRACENKD